MPQYQMGPDHQTDPGWDVVAVTKSDTVDDPGGPFRGLIIGVAGIVKLTTPAGTTVTFASGVLASGVVHPIRFTRIWNTTTAATDLYGVT